MSQNDKFRRDFEKVMKKAGARAATIAKASALSLQASMIQRSPVDTGRFKGNWVVSVGALKAEVFDDRTDTTPLGEMNKRGDSVMQGLEALAVWKPGQTIWITNSLPYGYRLEHGWSKQAPAGMVRLAVLEWRSKVEEAARKIKDE